MIAESTPPSIRGWAFGFHRAMDHLGAAIGPLLATLFLWQWPEHLQTLFLLTLLPGIAVVAILVFGLREPPRSVAAGKPFVWSLRLFDREFRLYLASLAVFTLGNSSDLFLLAQRPTGRARGAAADYVVRLSRGQKWRQHDRGSGGRAHQRAAIDRGRLAGLRACVPWLWFGQRAVARVGPVHGVRRVLLSDRAAGKNLGGAAGHWRAHRPGLWLVQLLDRRGRHAGQRVVRISLQGIRRKSRPSRLARRLALAAAILLLGVRQPRDGTETAG